MPILFYVLHVVDTEMSETDPIFVGLCLPSSEGRQVINMSEGGNCYTED